MAILYPFSLPQPDTTSGVVSVGLLSSEGGGPELNRRKSYNSRRTDFQMTFSMDNSTYRNEWLPWIQANGYDWFEMDVIVDRFPVTPINSPHRVRLTSPLTYAKQGDNWLSVSVSAELIPGDV